MYDTGLGGVRDDDLQVVALREIQHLVPFAIGVHAAAAGGNDALVVHFDALLAAAQVQGIQAFLRVDQVSQALRDRLYQHDFAVETCLFVGDIDKIVHERTQEVAFTELHHFFRSFFQNIAFVPGFFQDLVIQLSHIGTLSFIVSHRSLLR